MKQIRVLHLIDHLSLGGAQRGVLDLARARRRDKVFSLHFKSPGTQVELPADSLAFAGSHSAPGYALLLFRLLDRLRRDKFDIIHCHLPASWLFGVLLATLRPAFPAKYIFHEQGTILSHEPQYQFLARIASRMGIIIAVSQYLIDHLASIGIDRGKIKLLHNAINLAHFKPDSDKGLEFRRRHGISADSFVIGFAGRIAEVKGWRTLLEALSMTGEAHAMKALIAGIGPQLHQLEQSIVDLGLRQTIKYMAYIREMDRFYNALDICIVPSLIEPFGRTQLEAQACGIPVVCSDISGINETVDPTNAVLVPPDDPEALADSILRLKRDRTLRRELTKAGRGNAKRFGFPSYLARLEEVYAEISERD